MYLNHQSPTTNGTKSSKFQPSPQAKDTNVLSVTVIHPRLKKAIFTAACPPQPLAFPATYLIKFRNSVTQMPQATRKVRNGTPQMQTCLASNKTVPTS